VHRGNLAGYRATSSYYALSTCSPSLIETGRKLFDLESGNPNFGQFKVHNSGVIVTHVFNDHRTYVASLNMWL